MQVQFSQPTLRTPIKQAPVYFGNVSDKYPSGQANEYDAYIPLFDKDGEPVDVDIAPLLQELKTAFQAVFNAIPNSNGKFKLGELQGGPWPKTKAEAQQKGDKNIHIQKGNVGLNGPLLLKFKPHKPLFSEIQGYEVYIRSNLHHEDFYKNDTNGIKAKLDALTKIKFNNTALFSKR